jgi:hypothetical protein
MEGGREGEREGVKLHRSREVAVVTHLPRLRAHRCRQMQQSRELCGSSSAKRPAKKHILSTSVGVHNNTGIRMTAMRLWSEVWRHSDTAASVTTPGWLPRVCPSPHPLLWPTGPALCSGPLGTAAIFVEKLARDLRDWPAGRTSGAVS